MSLEQIRKEFPANGFREVGQFEKLPWQHLLFFERDDRAATQAAAPATARSQ
jgi:hypothetical protein